MIPKKIIIKLHDLQGPLSGWGGTRKRKKGKREGEGENMIQVYDINVYQ
jgi:hypothetical protein